MKRRSFVKSLGLMGSSVLVPSMMGGKGLIQSAYANDVPNHRLIAARADIGNNINFTMPAVLPQVINIFLYGGPSELAGNLTNIADIEANSQNSYFLNNRFNNIDSPSQNGFWDAAGGLEMDRMMNRGRLSIYRTINRVDDNSRAHRPSIFSNLTGKIGESNSRAGIATNIAAVLAANNAIAEDATFPFVTFEGESIIFNQSSDLPLELRAISLNQNLENPYARTFGKSADSSADLDALADTVSSANSARFQAVLDAFVKRDQIDTFVTNLKDQITTNAKLPNPDFIADSNDVDTRNEDITYPTTGFGPRLEKAIGLVINNPSTLFVSLGNEGIGGWDDHDSANGKYPARMQNLMRSLEVAAQHLEAAGKGNVVINVFGDFGRNVNLNNSLGWDHGNCQNLYTIGANPNAAGVMNAIPGRELGKLVGETVREGKTKENRQFTVPTENSYQCEPFAIAATIYKYFGMENPEVLTGGYAPIDETSTDLFISG